MNDEERNMMANMAKLLALKLLYMNSTNQAERISIQLGSHELRHKVAQAMAKQKKILLGRQYELSVERATLYPINPLYESQ